VATAPHSLLVSCSWSFSELQRQVRRRKRTRLRLAEPEFHHNVYVVLLSKAALKDLSILRRNPQRDPSKPAVYVGMTGLPVDHRFENHKNGYKSACLVRKYGVRLLPELFEHLNRCHTNMPFKWKRTWPTTYALRATPFAEELEEGKRIQSLLLTQRGEVRLLTFEV
jgi:hypothetical protein